MSSSVALRLYCDFNEGDDDGGYWVLFYKSRPLGAQLDELGLHEESEVTLFQDDGDFEVPATLRRGRTHWGEGQESWLAFPDWNRRVEIS